MAVIGKASILTLYSGVSARRHHSCGTRPTILQSRDVLSSTALMIVFRLRHTAPTQNSSSNVGIGSALILGILHSAQIERDSPPFFPPVMRITAQKAVRRAFLEPCRRCFSS